MKLANMKLRAKLIGTVCSLFILGCGLVVLMTILAVHKDSTRSAGEALLNMSQLGARLVRSNIDLQLTNIEGVAGRNVIRSMEWGKQQPAMEQEIKRLKYLSMAIVTPDHVARYPDGMTADLSDRDYIKKAFQGQPNMSSVIISKVNNSAVIMTAAPIRNDEGKITGVLIARLPATLLSDVTDKIRYGKGGYSYIIDGEGALIAHDNKQFVIEQKNFIKEAESKPEFLHLSNMMKRMTQKQTGFDEYPFLGKNRFFGYAPIEGTDWSIAAGALRDEVLSALDDLTRNIVLLAVIVLLVGAIATWFIALTITKPIKAAVEALDRISRGDMTQDLPEKLCVRKDEAGHLAQSMQRMTANFRSMLRDVTGGVQTLASSSTEMSAIAGQMSSGAQDTSSKSATVATAAEEMSANTSSVAAGMEQATTNLSSVATATEEMSATIGEIAANSEKARAISAEAGGPGRRRGRADEAAGHGRPGDRQGHRDDHEHLLADEPAGAERHDRGGAGRRGGQGLCRGRQRDQGAGPADGERPPRTSRAGSRGSSPPRAAAIADIDKIAGVIRDVSEIVATIATAIEEQASVTRDMARNIAEATTGVRDANQRVAQTATVSQEIARDIAAVNTASGEMTSASQQVQASSMDLSQLAEQLKAMVGRFKLDEGHGASSGGAYSTSSSQGRPFFEWSENLSVNVSAMDDQHKRFFVLINELHQGMKQGKGSDVLGGILNELARYTEYHFSAEEALLEQASYPELPQQKEAHRRFVDKVQDFQRRFNAGDRSVPVEAMNTVRDWLVSHIQKMDKKYGTCVNTGGSSSYGQTVPVGRLRKGTTGTPTV